MLTGSLARVLCRSASTSLPHWKNSEPRSSVPVKTGSTVFQRNAVVLAALPRRQQPAGHAARLAVCQFVQPNAVYEVVGHLPTSL